MNKQFLNTQIAGLARRSQNILSQLHGIESALEFYKKHKSFLSIPNAGRRTDEELTAFFKYLISEGGIEIDSEGNTIQPQIVLPDIHQSIAIYEIEKPLLSVRVQNVLKLIENENNYDESIDKKSLFIQKCFFEDFDFSKISNLGRKSKSELDSLKHKIFNSIVDPEAEEKSKLQNEIYKSKNKIFWIDFEAKERNELFFNGTYSFKRIFCIFLLFTDKIKEKTYFILKNKFFNQLNLDNKTISEKLNCSLERIRQIEINITQTTIPWAIDIVYNSFKFEPYDLPQEYKKNILILDNFPDFTFRGGTIEPNSNLSKTTYSYILQNSFELSDNYIQSHSKSFKVPSANLFISRSFIEETAFPKLIEWLDDQIYEFEIVDFEYTLEVLIKRYYDEQEMSLNNSSLQDLHIIIQNIKKEKFELNEKAIKRINKKNWIDSLLDEVYLFLKDRHEGQTTNVILDHVIQEKFNVEKEELLRHLNNHKSTFCSFGLGTWTLNEWKANNDDVGGSFREIVRNLLSKRNEPIHISELYEYLSSMRKVSLNTLRSNLKLETEGTFKFFNCSYIGLSEKQYSDYWYKLPKFRPVHLTHLFSEIKKMGAEKIMNELNLKYGYPKEHLKFIIENQNRKNI